MDICHPLDERQSKSSVSLSRKDERLDAERAERIDRRDEGNELTVSSSINGKEQIKSRNNQDSQTSVELNAGTAAEYNDTLSESPRTLKCDTQKDGALNTSLSNRRDDAIASCPTRVAYASSDALEDVHHRSDGAMSEENILFTTSRLNNLDAQPKMVTNPATLPDLSRILGDKHLNNIRECGFRTNHAAKQDLLGLPPLGTPRTRSTAHLPLTHHHALLQGSGITSEVTFTTSDRTASGLSQLDLIKGDSKTKSVESKGGARFQFGWGGMFKKHKSVDHNLDKYTGGTVPHSKTFWKSFRNRKAVLSDASSCQSGDTFAGLQSRMSQESAESERPKTLKGTSGLIEPPPAISPRRQVSGDHSQDPPPLPPRLTSAIQLEESATSADPHNLVAEAVERFFI